MCNAKSFTHSRNEIVGLANDLAKRLDLPLDVSGLPGDLRPRYRISPRQTTPIFYVGKDRRLICEAALWGLIVKGGKPGFAPTNARDDKLVSGWPWKMISRTQRCLVPADGFFEPEKVAGAKGTVPWSYYTMGNRQPFLMAGLWNAAAHPKTGEPVTTYTVATTDANSTIRVHDRMPVILDDDAATAWLGEGDVPKDLLRPYPGERMTGWRVIDAARNSRIPDHPGMIEPIAEQEPV